MKSFFLVWLYIICLNFKFTVNSSKNFIEKIFNSRDYETNLTKSNSSNIKKLKFKIKNNEEKQFLKENLNPMQSSPIWKSVLTPQIETKYFFAQP